jgi:hypothetical protein
MPIILALLVLCFPRLFLVYLKFFTEWFATGPTLLWQILGFIFAPFTLLWYVAVLNWFGGNWDLAQKVILVIAIVIDLGGGFGAMRKRR